MDSFNPASYSFANFRDSSNVTARLSQAAEKFCTELLGDLSVPKSKLYHTPPLSSPYNRQPFQHNTPTFTGWPTDWLPRRLLFHVPITSTTPVTTGSFLIVGLIALLDDMSNLTNHTSISVQNRCRRGRSHQDLYLNLREHPISHEAMLRLRLESAEYKYPLSPMPSLPALHVRVISSVDSCPSLNLIRSQTHDSAHDNIHECHVPISSQQPYLQSADTRPPWQDGLQKALLSSAPLPASD